MEQIFTPQSSSTSPLINCNICYVQYNMENNKPLLVCHRNHSICKLCLQSIKNNLRCPFCRQNIRPTYIRLNKIAAELIKMKQRNREDYKKRFIRIVQNERLVTNNDEEEFVDVSDLVSDIRQVPNIVPQRQFSIVLLILIFIELFFIQAPFGLYTFLYGLNFKEDHCFPNEKGVASEYLRNYLLVQGYIQCLVGMLTIYFTIFYYLVLLSFRHLACFYILLMNLVQTKSIIFSVVYLEMINNDSFERCSLTFKNFAVWNTCSNIVQIILGLFLIHKLSRESLRR